MLRRSNACCYKFTVNSTANLPLAVVVTDPTVMRPLPDTETTSPDCTVTDGLLQLSQLILTSPFFTISASFDRDIRNPAEATASTLQGQSTSERKLRLHKRILHEGGR